MGQWPDGIDRTEPIRHADAGVTIVLLAPPPNAVKTMPMPLSFGDVGAWGRRIRVFAVQSDIVASDGQGQVDAAGLRVAQRVGQAFLGHPVYGVGQSRRQVRRLRILLVQVDDQSVPSVSGDEFVELVERGLR